MADIPYGTDYPDAPWIDRDGHVLIDDGGKPTQVHRGQARIAYRLAERYQDKLLHVAGIGWHSWDGRRWAADDRGEAKRAVLAELRQALSDSLNDKELRADVRKCESASGVAGVLDLAAALVPFAATVADLDSDPHLLNARMGRWTCTRSNCGPTRPLTASQRYAAVPTSPTPNRLSGKRS